jgi:hypothetical protein
MAAAVAAYEWVIAEMMMQALESVRARKRRKRRLILRLVPLLLAALTVIFWADVNVLCLKCIQDMDRDPAWNVRRLKTCKRGVQLAAEALSVVGGRYDNWALEVLLSSPLDDHVKQTLEGIAGDDKSPLDQRTEAYYVLWKRSCDVQYLRSLFTLVREPRGRPTVIQRSRHRLDLALNRSTGKYFSETDPSAALDLTPQDFDALLTTSPFESCRQGPP